MEAQKWVVDRASRYALDTKDNGYGIPQREACFTNIL